MICKECKTENKADAKFCANCGKDLTKKTVKSATKEVKAENKKTDFIETVKTIVLEIKNNLLKPLDSMKKKSVEDIKSVAIMGGIISIAMMLIHMITSMINACRISKFNWVTGKTTYEWTTEGLKDLDYFKLIVQDLVVYAVIMMAIAFVFYIGCLIIKKTVKYPRILSMVFVAAIPVVLGNMVLAPVLALINVHFGVVVYVIATIYAITVFATLVNEELKLEGSVKLYFNAICYSVIILSAYFYAVNYAASLIGSLKI